MGTFYDTIGLTARELKEARAMAKGQEEMILIVMERTKKAVTPLQIEDLLRDAGISMLRSSVVRGIRNLTIAGLLIKTDELILERYGKRNHLWKLADPVEKVQGELFKTKTGGCYL